MIVTDLSTQRLFKCESLAQNTHIRDQEKYKYLFIIIIIIFSKTFLFIFGDADDFLRILFVD